MCFLFSVINFFQLTDFVWVVRKWQKKNNNILIQAQTLTLHERHRNLAHLQSFSLFLSPQLLFSSRNMVLLSFSSSLPSPYLTSSHLVQHPFLSPLVNTKLINSDLRINRGHLLVRTNLHIKYESFVINGFKDNQRKPFGLPTLAKQYTPSSSKGGIINN